MDQFAIIADMVRESERHADDQSADRTRAIEYYQGEMKDTPSADGRSSFVSRDVRAHVKKVLPSIMRTILGGDDVAEYQPVGEGDEDGAEQAGDYINRVVLPESGGKNAIYDAIHDALLLRNGILKWWQEEKRCVKFSKHSGLTEDELVQLVGEDGTEVVEQATREEVIETPEGAMPIMVYDVKIRRETTESRTLAAAVPRERFLIHPDAVTLDDSLLTGEKTEIRRSDLISMGYDRALVDGLSIADEDDDESDARRDFETGKTEAQKANDLIDYYDLYIRVDADDDGVAELRHMVFAGGLNQRNLLEDDEVDEVQFCDVCAMRQPHQWEGISLADDLSDIQRVKTVLLRETLDNIYWQNSPQPVFQEGAVEDEEAIFAPEFGKPIRVKQGFDVRAAYGFQPIPFVAQQSFGMLEYMDGEATDRTGVSDASAGLAPDALQNMTAKASAMIEQAGIGQTEMMVQTIAESLKPFFRGLLRLVIRHQDKPRTVRLRDEWVSFDPRHWNADMDVVVNTGLGAGTRERDMMVMMQVMGIQEKLIAGFGPDNPFVQPENLSNTLTKLAESAGLKTPSLFFTEPDPEEVKARLEEAKNQPNPEMQKLEAEMQLKRMDMQNKLQLEQQKMQTQASKEIKQLEADTTTKQLEIEAESRRQAEEFAYKTAEQERNIAWEREKQQMIIDAQREEAATRRQDEIWKHQAGEMARENERKQEAA